jgi:ABC-type nitrate/sulfonate/bicarbonate transport system substrate-binding protein
MGHKLIAFVTFIGLFSSPALAQEPKRPIAAMQALSTLDFGYLPTLLARSKGFFVQEGLDLKLLVVSVRVSVPALLSREVHFAAAGSSMPAALKGAPLKRFITLTKHRPSSLWCVRKSPDRKTSRGKRLRCLPRDRATIRLRG